MIHIHAALVAILLLPPFQLTAQEADDERKVRIEITRTENGETSTVTREFNMNEEGAMEDAMRELGVMDELKMIHADENLFIDMRRMKDGGAMNDMRIAMMVDPDEHFVFEHSSEPKAYLGVYYGNFNADECDESKRPPITEGATLTKVVDETPASRAGLKDGDVVVEIAGKKIASGKDLSKTISEQEPGDKVKIVYYREKKKGSVVVELGEREEDENEFTRNFNYKFWSPDDEETFVWHDGPRAFLGVEPGENGDGPGVSIGAVVKESAAEQMGLKAGDRVISINGKELSSFDDLAEMIGEMDPGDTVTLAVDRDGGSTDLTGELGEREDRMWVSPPTAPTPPHAPRAPRMEGIGGERGEMRREMDALRAEMQHLREEMRSEITREVRVTVGTIELSQEEKDILKAKGVSGLDSALELGDLRCFPNPSSGFFRLQFDVPVRGDLEVDVHNANGERIYHETISGYKGRYERTLDLSDQADGSYFMVIRQNGKALSRKLVKQ